MTDLGLELLAKLDNLNTLVLALSWDSGLTGAGFSAWTKHKNINEMEIRDGYGLTDDIFMYLQKIKSLKRIALPLSSESTNKKLFGGHILEKLASLKHLEIFDLSKRAISDDSLARFKRTAPDCKIVR